MKMTVTRETLARDRERRQRERAGLAMQYESAANVLIEHDYETDENHSAAVAHLLTEAERWKR